MCTFVYCIVITLVNVTSNLYYLETELTDVKDVLDLLQSPELKNLCKQMLLPSSTANQPKEQCIVALLKHCRQHRSLGASMMSPLVSLLKR